MARMIGEFTSEPLSEYWQREREDALRAEQELRLLRATLDSPAMFGGKTTDIVSLSLRKDQWALLTVLVEKALE